MVPLVIPFVPLVIPIVPFALPLGTIGRTPNGAYTDCLFSDCNGLVKPVHGSLSSVNISHGNHVTISCNPGYTLEGDGTLVCLSGFLTGPIGTCEAGMFLL